MNGNKYDNLFGDARDWIEDTLRDYDVPDPVIMQIGANFFVLQTEIDKMASERANKRDIFVEIAEDAHREEESKAQLIKESNFKRDAIRKNWLGAPIKNLTSLKRQLWSSKITNEFIWQLWGEGLRVKYNLLPRASRNNWTLHKTGSYTRVGETLVYAINGVEQRTLTKDDILKNMTHDSRRALVKKILKNNQRKSDKNS